ncbi:MAG TPA: hypothetical protein ENJ56_03550 [Anaerolineae bacterium]|nr:hypothetical protein [Anaerolineae bacterium]
MNTTYVANFDDLADVFDVYDFVVDQNRPITLKLSNIPGNGDNYDLYLYDANKLLIAASNRVGNNDELITTNLDAGGYFIIVVAEDNFLLSTGNYHLSLSTP